MEQSAGRMCQRSEKNYSTDKAITGDNVFKINEYFGGKVTSISFRTAKGPATVGVMAVGEYEFGTSTIEVMTVTSGKLSALLPGSQKWTDYGVGQSFTVATHQKFKVKADEESSYLCLFL